MTNDDFDPDFRGKFLQTIVDTYCPEISLDAGTILVQDTEGLCVFFQLSTRYVYVRTSKFSAFKNGPMTVIPGSIIYNDGRQLDATFCIAQKVRFPYKHELEWYYNQNTV